MDWREDRKRAEALKEKIRDGETRGALRHGTSEVTGEERRWGSS